MHDSKQDDSREKLVEPVCRWSRMNLQRLNCTWQVDLSWTTNKTTVPCGCAQQTRRKLRNLHLCLIKWQWSRMNLRDRTWRVELSWRTKQAIVRAHKSKQAEAWGTYLCSVRSSQITSKIENMQVQLSWTTNNATCFLWICMRARSKSLQNLCLCSGIGSRRWRQLTPETERHMTGWGVLNDKSIIFLVIYITANELPAAYVFVQRGSRRWSQMSMRLSNKQATASNWGTPAKKVFGLKIPGYIY
jgi:hypothetical protein